MAITTTVVTTSTTGTLAVAPTTDAQKVWLENLEPDNNLGSFSRAGYVYLVDQFFALPQATTARFSFTTGATGAQFDFWNIVSDTSNVLGKLLEGATVVTTGSPIQARNLNRNFSDTHTSVLEAASSVTGGTLITQELLTASKAAGGGSASAKIITLEPNTQYAFTFQNLDTKDTNVQLQVGFVEFYNGYNDIWINGLHDQTVRLRGGEKVQFQLEQAEGLWASSLRDGCKLAVMRQD